MANEPPQEAASDTGPETPREDVGEQAKASQAEANYREGNPQRSCGLCGHFDSKGHSCDVVEGDISPFGFSNLYLRQDNPFRVGEKEGFKGGKKVDIALVGGTPIAAAVTPAAAPALRIGGKRY